MDFLLYLVRSRVESIGFARISTDYSAILEEKDHIKMLQYIIAAMILTDTQLKYKIAKINVSAGMCISTG